MKKTLIALAAAFVVTTFAAAACAGDIAREELSFNLRSQNEELVWTKIDDGSVSVYVTAHVAPTDTSDPMAQATVVEAVINAVMKDGMGMDDDDFDALSNGEVDFDIPGLSGRLFRIIDREAGVVTYTLYRAENPGVLPGILSSSTVVAKRP